METLTVIKTKVGNFKIAYDGIILGDDRGFQTEDGSLSSLVSCECRPSLNRA